jgi:transcriptional regulator NrdR family protein
MNCPYCNHSTNRVIDTAQSSKSYTVNKGKYYLWQWGIHMAKPLPKQHDSFIARSRRCKKCNQTFRTLETIQKS